MKSVFQVHGLLFAETVQDVPYQALTIDLRKELQNSKCCLTFTCMTAAMNSCSILKSYWNERKSLKLNPWI